MDYTVCMYVCMYVIHKIIFEVAGMKSHSIVQREQNASLSACFKNKESSYKFTFLTFLSGRIKEGCKPAVSKTVYYA